MADGGRRVLVLGGARSGKSAHAESLLREESSVDYVATAAQDSADAEWAERIARHRQRRPAEWNTIETTDLATVLSAEGSAVLLDSVTAWLAAAMEQAGIWTGAPAAQDRLATDIDAAVLAWVDTGRLVIAVTDEVGSGVVPESASGRLFRDSLGLLNQRLAASADEVWLVTAGIAQRLR